MRVCNRPACIHGGEPQSASAFYRGKAICKDCMRRENREHGRIRNERIRTSPFVVDREPSGYLDVGPWRDWIARQVELAGGYNAGGVKAIAWQLGVAERTITRWLKECEHVTLDVVDRALCLRGTPWLLRDLYPHLYEFEDAA